MSGTENVVDLEGARFDRGLESAYREMVDEFLGRFPTLARRRDGGWSYWSVRDTADGVGDLERGRVRAAHPGI